MLGLLYVLKLVPQRACTQILIGTHKASAHFHESDGVYKTEFELVKRYKDKLINFVFRLVSDRDQAEDIIQDTMLKLYTHKHYYKNIAKFSTHKGVTAIKHLDGERVVTVSANIDEKKISSYQLSQMMEKKLNFTKQFYL